MDDETILGGQHPVRNKVKALSRIANHPNEESSTSRLTKACSALVLFSCLANGQNTPAEKPAPTDTIRLWVSEKEVNSVQGQFSSAALLKEMNAKCVGVVLTDRQERADYRLEAGHAWCCTPRGESRSYLFTLFNKDGDAVYSTKTHTMANAAKDVCKAIGHGIKK